MKRALLILGAAALLLCCGKPKPEKTADPKAKTTMERPAMKAGMEMERPARVAPSLKPPGTATTPSGCTEKKLKLWASCQAAILMKYKGKPSFKLQFPGCKPEAVKSGKGGVHTVMGTFSTWNTGYKRGFICTLKKSPKGFDVVSSQVSDTKKPGLKKPGVKAKK